MKKKIRIGSRESKLAVEQANIIIKLINKNYPEIKTELITMKTTGDIILNKTLDKIGGKGLFIKELDKALLEDKIDISVHSLKDMPTEISKDLPILAYSKRENPQDVLILPENIDKIDFNKPIGTSSKRRELQIRNIFKNIDIKPIRGNILTRIDKLDKGEYSCIILAFAGIKRLGLEKRINRIFSTNEMIPAAGQGILAIQGRKNENYDFLDCLNNINSKYCALSERAFIKELDGGCGTPAAAYAQIYKNEICLNGLYFDEVKNEIHIGKKIGNIEDCQKIGYTLAKELKAGVYNE